MIPEQYFDMRNLAPTKDELGGCPVSGCTAALGKVDSQWGEMDYCPDHRIRIHAGSRTFVYYNGPDAVSKRDAALRNIFFERKYFEKYILGNAAKAESHRICHETSEDALTWNVFSKLARDGLLAKLLSKLTNLDIKDEPELYLWGLKISLDDLTPPRPFSALANARNKFENKISKFLTEPDIMLFVPGQVLVLIEAKFTSGNTIASADAADDLSNEKPKSRDGIIGRYNSTALPNGMLLTPKSTGPFYSQLYRNVVFAMYMANQLKVEWAVVNLIGSKQFDQRKNKAEFQDPTQFIHSLLPEESRSQFLFYNWERLYADHVANDNKLNDLAEYIKNKSANCAKAFAI